MLWPRDVTGVEDLPHDLAVAIEHGVRVVGWEETLGRDEIPPEWMWPFPDELNLWFEDVQAAREEKASGNSPDEDEEDLVDNDLAPARPKVRR